MPQQISDSERENVLTVSQLSYLIRRTLESHVGMVWVEGEISSATQAQSGHTYLTLKDAKSQISGIIWRSTMERLQVEVLPGQKVLCRGNIEVYAPRGEYQIVIDRIEQTGLGALQKAFRQLHDRLKKEGLFEPHFKKPLPSLPGHIGVVTSPAGAAIYDFLKILLRRWPKIRVTVIPTSVQGPEAKLQIARAIMAANRMSPSLDALVVTRGGGSLEDLWAFNEEVVVRAVFESNIPVMSAVGHEIDITLCDLAADVRAATPSEAAEKMVPDLQSLNTALESMRKRLVGGLQSAAQGSREQLKWLADSPVLRRPYEWIDLLSHQCNDLDERMVQGVQNALQSAHTKLGGISRELTSVSPLQVLSRGYSITQDSEGNAIRTVDQLQIGQTVVTTFEKGKATSEITKTDP